MEVDDVKADFRNAFCVFDNGEFAFQGLRQFISDSEKYADIFDEDWYDIANCTSWDELERRVLAHHREGPIFKEFIKDFQRVSAAYSGWVSRDGKFFRRSQGQLYRFTVPLSDKELLSLSPYANIERKKREVKDGENTVFYLQNITDNIIDNRRGKILEMDFQKIVNNGVCKPVNGRIKVIKNGEAYTARFHSGFKDKTTQKYLYKIKDIKKKLKTTMNTIIQKHNQQHGPVTKKDKDLLNLKMRKGLAKEAFERLM